MEKNKHLDLDARIQIETGLSNGFSFRQIAAEIGKDPGTISKEVRAHCTSEKKGGVCLSFNDCIHRKSCSLQNVCNVCTNKRKNPTCCNCGRCIKYCKDYEKEYCLLLKKPPYVCNGCSQIMKCRLEKCRYHALTAQREYEQLLKESRSGFSLTEDERQNLDNVISPLLKQGQSLHHICQHNTDRIMYCEKTLYEYADTGLFEARNLDMPRKVRFKPRCRKSSELKIDKKCREGRTYNDFQSFMKDNADIPIVEIDSVEGKKGCAVLLTVYFRKPKLQLAIKRDRNDSASVSDFFKYIYDELGIQEYSKLFPLVLADNGSEFSNPTTIEAPSSNETISKVFYCDPSNPGQKGGCEFNHEFIRRVIPKGKDLTAFSQNEINLMMSHINSYSRPDLGDKSPIEMFQFIYPDSRLLSIMNITQIPSNEINLTPSLLLKDKQDSES